MTDDQNEAIARLKDAARQLAQAQTIYQAWLERARQCGVPENDLRAIEVRP